jgi:hypothetical protein
MAANASLTANRTPSAVAAVVADLRAFGSGIPDIDLQGYQETCDDVDELIEALRPLVATSFEEARDNEDQRRAAIASCRYPPAEMLWCRADVLNPCWIPGTPYTGKHWGWTPIMGDGGAVCEHCRLRGALARVTGGAE